MPSNCQLHKLAFYFLLTFENAKSKVPKESMESEGVSVHKLLLAPKKNDDARARPYRDSQEKLQ